MNMKSLGMSSLTLSVLAGLVVQNTAVVLLMKFIRLPKLESDQELFISSTIVLTTEAAKFGICTLIVWQSEAKSLSNFLNLIKTQLLGFPVPFLLMCVPSLIYVVQNNLIYLAISNLEAAVFQVTYQLKLFLAAVCARIFLGRSLSQRKWIAVFMLFLGVVCVQMPMKENSAKDFSSIVDDDELEFQYFGLKALDFNTLIGIAAAVGSAFGSAMAGTFIEWVMKKKSSTGMEPQSLWLKNLQLAFFSLFFGALACFMQDSAEIKRKGFFTGYDSYVWFTVVLQAGGGLLIGAVLKYASNVAKGFATSISMITSSILSIFLFGFSPTTSFVMGAILVIISVVLYSLPENSVVASQKEKQALPDIGFSKSRI